MMETWRSLLYPLGYLATLVFGGRLLVQWLQSEVQGRSVVTRGFWRLSLLGNLLLMTHGLIQMQFHVSLIQAANAVVSWRNLNLMEEKSEHITFRNTCLILFLALTSITCLFGLQGYFFANGSEAWFRVPVHSWQMFAGSSISMQWHFIGFLGLILFNSRFWIQWWGAERQQRSFLGPSFWWMSLLGEALCLAYFLRIGDVANLIGPVFGVVPYLRNLMLTYRPRLSSGQKVE